MKQQQTLADQIATAEKGLADLKQERSGLPENIRNASSAADADRLTRLGDRAKELPVRIAAAMLKLERLQLSEKQSRLPALHDSFVAATLASQAAQERFQTARESMYQANTVTNAAQSALGRLQDEIEAGASRVTGLEAKFERDQRARIA